MRRTPFRVTLLLRTIARVFVVRSEIARPHQAAQPRLRRRIRLPSSR